MENNWNIKITESTKPLKGFSVSVENNGEYMGAVKGVVRTFDEAISQGRNIVLSAIRQIEDKKKYARAAQALFTKKYLSSNIFNDVYGVSLKLDEKGVPYLSVSMDTNNKYLMQLVPDSLDLPNTMFTYKIKKELGERVVSRK